jgi:hypothetical protein
MKAARQMFCAIWGCGISLKSTKSPMLWEAVFLFAAIRGFEYPLRILPFEPSLPEVGDDKSASSDYVANERKPLQISAHRSCYCSPLQGAYDVVR